MRCRKCGIKTYNPVYNIERDALEVRCTGHPSDHETNGCRVVYYVVSKHKRDWWQRLLGVVPIYKPKRIPTAKIHVDSKGGSPTKSSTPGPTEVHKSG